MRKRKNRDQDGLYWRKDSPYWWVSLTDASGQRTRRSTGTANRREAEALLAKWRLETYRTKHWDEQPRYTFDELMLGYLKEASPLKRDAKRDTVAVKNLYPIFSGRILADIAPADIRRFMAQRRADGAAASTINRETGLFSAACNYACREWGWRIDNPAKGCKLKEPEGRIRWLNRGEAQALMAAASKLQKSQYLADLIRLALHTGMRREEMLGLEWRRVNLQADLIYLEASHTKAGTRRSVPINREARAALLNRARFKAVHCPNTPWVFCHKTGERIRDIKNGFARARWAAGISDFRFHDLRHTCAAWLVTAGVPLAEVRDILGHASIQMTERYAHLAPENLAAALARIEASQSRFGHVTDQGIIEKIT